ncbi:hypothetical protein O181_095813, partial [Austropuccinia psidii MF-1]|nr:hypothetical protein [Austropuccinia psidii MF-1]
MVPDATTTIAGYNMVSQVLPTGQRLAAYFDKPKIFNDLLSIHQAINFDLVGANQQVTMQNLTKTTEYRAGLNVLEGLGKYNLTKVVIIYPQFIIKNNAKLPTFLKEDVSNIMFIIKPGKRVLLSLFNNDANTKLVIEFESPMGKQWHIVIPFERQESVNVAERTFHSCNPLYFLLNAVTMAIGTISGAPLTLNQLKVENARMSQGQLMTRLIQHYQNKGLSQLYRIIASADFLGNPAGLFNSVSSGVQDLFYEPLNGVVLHGTSELGVGIAYSRQKKCLWGDRQHFKNYRLRLSAAVLDSNWARKGQRRQFPNRNKVNGLATGTSAFVGLLASSISGIAVCSIFSLFATVY